MEQIILVDENDRDLGVGEKIEVHKQGKLHRAFSVFVLNSKGEILLQRRAMSKYHCGGLWSNACCGHPRPGEDTEKAAHRRLREEMGFDCEVNEFFSFIYKTQVDHGLTEHEYLHVFFGDYDDDPVPNPEEAEDWKWISTQELEDDMSRYPENYTPWFLLSIPRVVEYLSSKKI